MPLFFYGIGYYELNARAESERGGPDYLSRSFASAQIVAVPWRAYMEIDDDALRDAILDFFEDAASGQKRASTATAGRLARIVGSLAAKEADEPRLSRIRALVERLEARRRP